MRKLECIQECYVMSPDNGTPEPDWELVPVGTIIEVEEITVITEEDDVFFECIDSLGEQLTLLGENFQIVE